MAGLVLLRRVWCCGVGEQSARRSTGCSTARARVRSRNSTYGRPSVSFSSASRCSRLRSALTVSSSGRSRAAQAALHVAQVSCVAAKLLRRHEPGGAPERVREEHAGSSAAPAAREDSERVEAVASDDGEDPGPAVRSERYEPAFPARRVGRQEELSGDGSEALGCNCSILGATRPRVRAELDNDSTRVDRVDGTAVVIVRSSRCGEQPEFKAATGVERQGVVRGTPFRPSREEPTGSPLQACRIGEADPSDNPTRRPHQVGVVFPTKSDTSRSFSVHARENILLRSTLRSWRIQRSAHFCPTLALNADKAAPNPPQTPSFRPRARMRPRRTVE